MESFDGLMSGFAVALTWQNLLYCLIGVTVGQLVGVLPGVGPTTATALLIPLTYGMSPASAIIMLSGIYYGGMYGGTITSVLINTPGEAASVITCIDGYKMAKQGRAGAALGIAALGSFIGGIASVIGLALVGPPLAELALRFGPTEMFSLMVLGLTMVVGLMGTSIVRGLVAMFFGLILSTIGMDPISGALRFTFGQPFLISGIDLVTIAMGLFGLSEIFLGMENLSAVGKPEKLTGLFPKREELRGTSGAIFRGTWLGFFIGLIPGTSSAVPALLSYSIEKALSKTPERFGNGAIEGVAGPETANNSYCGGAMIPLLTLGIPSSPTIAILLGAFIMHGLTPGPILFKQNPDFVWGVIDSMLVGNAMLLAMNLPLAGLWARIALVPPKLLYPIVLILSIIGAYTVSNDLWDVGVMLVFGVIGYVMKKLDIPMAPIVLTYVLGAMMEKAALQSVKMNDGSLMGLVESPISLSILILATIVFLGSVYAEIKNKKAMLAGEPD
ncbi:tripartite tricarboxylate transporter permease [Xanthobacteraceae bacterium Astr-EGSB]|uniref:tripartite tricarboxylate transporter permease n=1 Tax=Astrobacterium formosum TaxID=3069710 RepID=UPI0027B56E06|nr:tripartite tricarboxylate transporter permease [Xanthobacteraceae bacterium Astr-EGSB]